MIDLETVNNLALALDPSLILDDLAFGTPEVYQRKILRSKRERLLLLAHRQAGKSTSVSALALHTALHYPESLILLVSASQRQSGELFRKVVAGYHALGDPIPSVEDSATTLALENGSRVVSLPDSPDTIVGFSAPRLVVIDEAARTSDQTFYSLMPMLAISRGRLVAMSTPRGKRGWFHEAWHDTGSAWERLTFLATENARIDPIWLAEQRLILGERWFTQEYLCEFVETEGQVFDSESIESAFVSTRPPLVGFGGTL